MDKLKSIIKNNNFIYYVYNRFFSIILRTIGLFIKMDNKLVLFNSFGGKKFDDSPKEIYLYMKKNERYKDFKLIWAIDNPNQIKDFNIEYVKNNTFKFFITALKAKYWITNSSIERGLKFKKKQTIYINTWHGSPLKKMGTDTNTTTSKFKTSLADIFYAQSKFDIDIFSRTFNQPRDSFVLCGLPRNDELCNVSKDEIDGIKKKLNIPSNKMIILYAPTFREFNYDINGCFIAPPLTLEKWKKMLGDNYILLFRAHYEINKVLNIKDDDFIRNVTDYPNLNELLKISDMLISDYSSIMIDYSILDRPIFAYTYDYEDYSKRRGLYFDLDKVLPNGIQKTEEELLDLIVKCDYEAQKENTNKFKKKFIEECGKATKYIDKIIDGR